MKNLLILTDALPPAFAPRMGYLIGELCQQGYEVTAFATQYPQTHCHLPMERANVHILAYPSTKNRLFSALKSLLGCKNRWFYRAISNTIQNQPFDAVLCSTYETFPLPTALKIAQERNIPLIADLRDITEQFGSHYYKNRHPKAPWLGKWFANIKIKARNKVIKQANAVTSVSSWHVNYLKQYNPNVHLVYNGYDAKEFYFKPISSNKFSIVYTGRLVDEKLQDPTLFLQALEQLISTQQIDKKNVAVHWYTDLASQKRLQGLVSPYTHVQAITQYHGLIPTQQIPAVLWESSVALILTNQQTSDGPKGMMTTKFFEALGVEKPVLCVKSDEACLSHIIVQTNAGVAAKEVEKVKAFLLEKYAEWQKNGYTHQVVNTVEKEKLSRAAMAKEFEKVCCQF